MNVLNQKIPSRTRDVIIGVAAVISVGAYVLVSRLNGGTGFPLDDSWIHQVYARNLAQTGQWAFIPGQPSGAATSPLYILLLALGYWLNVPYLTWAFGLGALFLASGGWISARVAERIFPEVQNVGLWSGLAIATAWHFVWAATAGMETMLFVSASLLVIWLALRQRDVQRAFMVNGMVCGATCALLIAIRPEGLLLAGLFGLVMLLARPQPNTNALLRWCAGAVLGGAIAIAPYALLNLSLTGSLLPDTVAAKQAQNIPLLTRPFVVNLWSMVEPMTPGGQTILIFGIPVALWLCFRGKRLRQQMLNALPVIWALALLILFTLRLPGGYQHSRYIMASLDVYLIFGAAGTLHLVSRRYSNLLARATAKSLAIVTPILFLIFWVNGSFVFSREVLLIDSEMVKTANWIQQHIPRNQLIATYDIGVIGYFASSPSQPRPLLDIAGLINPEVVPLFRDPAGLLALMRQRNVRYLVVRHLQWIEIWLGEPERWAFGFCQRFNAQGLDGGMAVFEYRPDGSCDR